MYDHQHFILGDLNDMDLPEIRNSPTARSIAYPDQTEVRNGMCRRCTQFKDCHKGLESLLPRIDEGVWTTEGSLARSSMP